MIILKYIDKIICNMSFIRGYFSGIYLKKEINKFLYKKTLISYTGITKMTILAKIRFLSDVFSA
ncbi:hypothetical protein MASR2M70_03120 [Bacillota bacterium]